MSSLSQTLLALPSGRHCLRVEPQPSPSPAEKPRGKAIVAVIDVSGSMDCTAAASQEKGTPLFSLLSLVKHSLTTVISLMGPEDVACLVTFSDDGKCVLQPTLMDSAGKTLALAVTAGLRTEGSTNIWVGLTTAMEAIRGSPLMEGREVVTMLLTDGCPNVEPPGGTPVNLERRLAESPVGSLGTIHTFGYGYSLDSELLVKVANLGRGAYSFIPDGTMVGTVFITFASYVLSAAASGTQTLLPSTQVGLLQWGQAVEVPLEGELSPAVAGLPSGSEEQAMLAEVRRDLLEVLQSALGMAQHNIEGARALLAALVSRLEPLAAHPFVEDLLLDLQSEKASEGQIGKAFEKPEWFEKWGRHYIPSVISGHKLCFCNNFKDKAVQHYGGEAFKANQATGEELFKSLPPPTPKGYAGEGNHGSFGGAARMSSSGSAPVMTSYYNVSGGCLHADTPVLLADGSSKRVAELRKGESLQTGQGEGHTAQLLCLVESTCSGPRRMLRLPSGLVITPWHPVVLPGSSEWVFPEHVPGAVELQQPGSEPVYNYVLEGGVSLLAGGSRACSLAHGLQGPVIGHAYFGGRVLLDLQQLPGWEQGRVSLDAASQQRDPETQLVVGLRGKQAGQAEQAQPVQPAQAVC